MSAQLCVRYENRGHCLKPIERRFCLRTAALFKFDLFLLDWICIQQIFDKNSCVGMLSNQILTVKESVATLWRTGPDRLTIACSRIRRHQACSLHRIQSAARLRAGFWC